MTQVEMTPIAGIITYQIDAADKLVSIGGAWNKFARENNAVELAAANVLGRSLWEFVKDETVRHLYGQILKKVRAGRVMKFDFRCDAPAEQRHLRMVIEPADHGSVQFQTRPIKIHPRPAGIEFSLSCGSLIDPVIACSWCNRIRTSDREWVELEKAVEIMKLFAVAPNVVLSHGICTSCRDRVMEEIHLS